ncbi:hypothetical protein TRIUR3_11245 [Triticum urartu]|uniref:Uncharacterized protein n=2 Tax=Triticum urartu TaxID=4572 RepID=M7ZX22_TRIUA|nr:hypothetical protein TRIUR3_11245 [Triticum urartu]
MEESTPQLHDETLQRLHRHRFCPEVIWRWAAACEIYCRGVGHFPTGGRPASSPTSPLLALLAAVPSSTVRPGCPAISKLKRFKSRFPDNSFESSCKAGFSDIPHLTKVFHYPFDNRRKLNPMSLYEKHFGMVFYSNRLKSAQNTNHMMCRGILVFWLLAMPLVYGDGALAGDCCHGTLKLDLSSVFQDERSGPKAGCSL